MGDSVLQSLAVATALGDVFTTRKSDFKLHSNQASIVSKNPLFTNAKTFFCSIA